MPTPSPTDLPPLDAAAATLAAQHPELLPVPHAGRTSEHALVAKNIRALLKKHFPGVPFSVKADSGTISACVRVTWDAWPDSPEPNAVQTLIEAFKAGTFDGHTDSYTYTNDPDRRAFQKLFGSVEYVRANAQKVTPEQLVEREAAILRKEMARQEKKTPKATAPTARARTRL